MGISQSATKVTYLDLVEVAQRVPHVEGPVATLLALRLLLLLP